jgi:hypothetical protein
MTLKKELIMCEKKKTTYYYTPETESMIKKGFEMFLELSSTGTLTLTGLIDICIRKAVEEDPEVIKELRQLNRERDKKIHEVTEKSNFYRGIVLQSYKVEKLKRELDSRVQEAINLE